MVRHDIPAPLASASISVAALGPPDNMSLRNSSASERSGVVAPSRAAASTSSAVFVIRSSSHAMVEARISEALLNSKRKTAAINC